MSTVRDWKREFATDGVSPAVIEAVTKVAQTALEQMVDVRDLAIEQLRSLIPKAGVAQIPSLGNLVGIFTDKIDRAAGMANQRIEVTHRTLPDVDIMVELLPGLVNKALSDASERADEIIDAEVVEHSVLELEPPVSEQGEPLVV